MVSLHIKGVLSPLLFLRIGYPPKQQSPARKRYFNMSKHHNLQKIKKICVYTTHCPSCCALNPRSHHACPKATLPTGCSKPLMECGRDAHAGSFLRDPGLLRQGLQLKDSPGAQPGSIFPGHVLLLPEMLLPHHRGQTCIESDGSPCLSAQPHTCSLAQILPPMTTIICNKLKSLS